jgi:SOS-response transcriptional repressor LexA
VPTAPLTEPQERILHVIRAFIGANGYPPTVREIGARVHLSSTSTVLSHLKSLQRRGVIRRDPTKPRAIVIIGDGCPACGNAPTVPSVTLPILSSSDLAARHGHGL